MRFLKKHFKRMGFTFLFLLFTQMAMAQITFPDDVDDEGPAAPIDGLIGAVMAAGMYMGAKKSFRSDS